MLRFLRWLVKEAVLVLLIGNGIMGVLAFFAHEPQPLAQQRVSYSTAQRVVDRIARAHHVERARVSPWPNHWFYALWPARVYGAYRPDLNVIFLAPWGLNLNTTLHEAAHMLNKNGRRSDPHSMQWCLELQRLLAEHGARVALANVYRFCRERVEQLEHVEGMG